MPPDPAARDVTVRGVRMRVLDAGRGPPVVLVHGFLVGRHEFDDIVPLLARDFRVLVPDLPGFGESEKPQPARYPYGIEAFADALVDMIAALDVGRAGVVGHSMGGGVALALAADHPELVDRLVLEDALCYPVPLDWRSRLPTWPVVGPFAFKQLLGRSAFRSYFRGLVYSKGFPFPSARVDGYYASFNAPAARESAYATLRSIRDTRCLVARLPRVKAPTLVVWGRGDRHAAPDLGHRLAREIPAARLRMLDAGHSPHEELPDAFVGAVTAFLRGDAEAPRDATGRR